MKDGRSVHCILSLVLFTGTSLAACKNPQSGEWSEADLESLHSIVQPETPPPQNILAQVMISEREVALKIINSWAGFVNKVEEKNPNSPLNQIRRLFDPDHMKKMTLQDAFKRIQAEGSGAHGAAKKELRPQDSLYHAVWSRIADAAGLVGFPRSSKHMKHYLANSGQPMRYSASETDQILKATDPEESSPQLKSSAQFVAHQIMLRTKSYGAEPSRSEAEMIGRMTRRERAFYLARLSIIRSLGEFVRSKKIQNPADLANKLAHLKTKNFLARSVDQTGGWISFRPIGKYYSLEISKPQSDLYFALGSYSGIFSSIPIEVKADGEHIKIRFTQSISIFDNYNWDDGKFVTLFSGWCWKLDSGNCDQIEKLTSLSVTDKSIGRLHKLGIAREFEIYGKTKITTVWDSVRFDDLRNPQKEKVWQALDKSVSELLTPMELIPD